MIQSFTAQRMAWWILSFPENSICGGVRRQRIGIMTDWSYPSGPVLAAGNPGVCSQIRTFLLREPWLGRSSWLHSTSSRSCTQKKREEWGGKRGEAYRNSLALCNFKQGYHINKLVGSKSLGYFHNKSKTVGFSLEYFLEVERLV